MLIHRRLRPLVLASLGCSFDATGLGESTGAPGPASTGDASSGGPASATTGPDPTTGATTTAVSVTAASTSGGSDSATGSDTGSTTAAPTCGDGGADPGEACDDGPDNGPDRPCTPACGVNVCGDGYPLDPGETCDDGNQDDADACRNDCTLSPTCGNAKLDEGEQCDDANEVDTDACIGCKKAVCGDGFVRQNVESCDDGLESATCNADCTVAKCGDMKLNMSAGEVCDLGLKNGVYASGCAADCKDKGPFCGDGVVTAPDENCDPQAPLPSATCTMDCKLLICADGHDDCDSKFPNGCEIDLNTDEANCGECGEKCQVWQCKNGSCSP
jgi:cysteine-rich repeat protein